MVPGSVRLAVCAGLLLMSAARAPADGPPSAARRAPSASAVAAPAPPVASTPLDAEAQRARADATERLKHLPELEKDQTPAQRALRDIWNERLVLIEDWQKAVQDRIAAENPGQTPDREIAEQQAKIEQARAYSEQLAKSPESVLPELFRIPAERVDDAKLVEMSRAIEDRRATLVDRTSELENHRKVPAEHASALHDLGVERDRAHARKSTLPTLRASLETALAQAATEEARLLARERLLNFRWTGAIAEERMSQAEVKLAFESRRVEAIDLNIKAYEMQVKAIQQLLGALSKRYAAVAERRKLALQTQAVLEQARAAASDDPVVKFTARRSAEIHQMEAQLVEHDRILSSNPPLSLEEQKALADHAESDLATLKQLVQVNRVGGLVALRLNNDFRRLTRERALVQRNELAQSSALNAHYENALTETELSFINDERDDQFERDAFIETLPPEVRASAAVAINALEARHRELLARKKDVLEKLLHRAEGTYAQVTRRLRSLDEQYAFIRTHIFWVRDSEPLGPSTVVQAERDAAKLAAAVVRLGSEPLDRTLWTPVSAEFGLMVAGLVILPPFIVYGRRRLKSLIAVSRIPTIAVRID